MFISSIVSVIAFIFLIFLCFKYIKLHHAFLFKIGHNAVEATNENSCPTLDHLYIHISIALAFFTGLMSFFYLIQYTISYYKRYRTHLSLTRISRISSGPNISIALNFSNIFTDINIHVASLRTPLSLLSLDTMHPFPKFRIRGSNNFYSTLSLDRPLLLRHLDCSQFISTPTDFPLGFFQSKSIRSILSTSHFVRLVAFQDDIQIPLSRLMTGTGVQIPPANLPGDLHCRYLPSAPCLPDSDAPQISSSTEPLLYSCSADPIPSSTVTHNNDSDRPPPSIAANQLLFPNSYS